jgi:hypothetical protein
MKRDWCIDTADAGLSEPEVIADWRGGETPGGFVNWFAEKYGLIAFSDGDYFRVQPALRTTRAMPRR